MSLNRAAYVAVAALSILVLASPARATDPVEVAYMLNCQGCHLPDGSGYPERNVPSLTGQMAKFLWVDGGREFLVQVPGAAMSDLADDQLADVLNWMVQRFSADQIPPGFVLYGGGEVAGLRTEPLVNVTERRAALIEKIEALNLAEGTP